MKKVFFCCAFLAGGAAGFLLLDRALARPGRLRAAACRDNLIRVADALLLHEKEQGRALDDLRALVPGGLSESMVYCPDGLPEGGGLPGPEFRYRFDPSARRVRCPREHRRQFLLPRPEVPTSLEVPLLFRVRPPSPAAAPGEGALVFEAEEFSDHNFGWEIREEAGAGGGRALFNKEGVGNHFSQERKFGDFFNAGGNRETARAVYRVAIPQAGTYHFQSRVMTSATHCSNQIKVFLDGNEKAFLIGGKEIPPFAWRWDSPKPLKLRAGVHEFRLYPWEDGVSLDQFRIAPSPCEGDAVFLANAKPLPAAAPPRAFLVHEISTRALVPGAPPRLNVWVRPTGEIPGLALLETRISLPEGDRSLLSRTFRLESVEGLSCVPVDLSALPIGELPRREYLLTSTLTVDGAEAARATTALLRPYRWRVLGMLPFTEAGAMEEPPVEGAERRAPSGGPPGETNGKGSAPAWEDFPEGCLDAFGVMNFGLFYARNKGYGPENRLVFARARVRVPRDGRYLFKVLGDDQMVVWVDGREIARKAARVAANRGAILQEAELAAGVHRISFALNQERYRWEGGLFIRGEGDTVCDVTGE